MLNEGYHVRLHNCFLKRRNIKRISIKCAEVSQQNAMLFWVCDLRSQRLAGNKCMLQECCAAHHDMARPDDEQRNNEDNGKSRPKIHSYAHPL